MPEIETVESAVERGLCTAEEARAHEMTGAAVAGEVSAPDMALAAAKDALRGHDPGDIGLLLYTDVWHQGPDGWYPQYYLQHYLLGGRALALEMRQGCNGVFYAMELAAGYLRGFPDRGDAMVVAADNFGTPLVDRWRSAPFLFGDAAAALVLSTRAGFAQVLAMGTVSVPELEQEHRAGEPLHPPGATTGAFLDFKARERRFNEQAAGESALRQSWLTAHMHMLKLVNRLMSEAGIRYGDITRAVFTNLAPESIERRWMDVLRLPMEKSTWDYGRTIGHTGAGDPVLSLHHLLSTGALRPGDHVVMGSVGSGGSISCAVVKILSVPQPG
ncbi:ketoacyl-ACP synthase III family protein [Nonomuraea sp. MCN248]|uniref:Ketoacyl-ACP synthase III family protein n=1 Tax=Nonomuraea corallina TaxID=2989783 RepID=A0ABT4SMN0_9ACTN|nr:ketoacyl-ACP synthase III family protein [Nonomuraea corallina]MDA0638488.1 ketoacyl-ACP synthase III family protein [Nonomuraea corallina]